MEWIIESGLIIAVILLFYIPAMFGVYYLAERYGRNAVGWTIGSLFLSPILSVIILWCRGKTYEKWEEKIIDEEMLRKRIRESITCLNCQSPNNRENQFCINCGTELT